MRILLLSVFMVLSANVWAANIAVLDLRVAIFQSDAGQEAVKEPQAQLAAVEKQIQQEQAELQEMETSLKQDELTLGEDEIKRRQRELAQRRAALRNSISTIQRQVQQMEQQLIAQFRPQAETHLKKIIEERKLDLVLRRQVSLFSADTVDITNELTRRLNEEK